MSICFGLARYLGCNSRPFHNAIKDRLSLLSIYFTTWSFKIYTQTPFLLFITEQACKHRAYIRFKLDQVHLACRTQLWNLRITGNAKILWCISSKTSPRAHHIERMTSSAPTRAHALERINSSASPKAHHLWSTKYSEVCT